MIEDILCVICETIFEVVAEAIGGIVTELLADFSINFLDRKSFIKSSFSDEIISLDIFKSNKENL